MPDFYMAFPGFRRKALTLSYDDGVEQDIRLIEIMNKHGLKGTFNLNSGLYAKEGTVYPQGQVHRRMSRSQVTQVYKDCGQEVAMHAYEHADLVGIPIDNVPYQIMKDKEQLEAQFGRIIRGFAYPYGTVNNQVANLLRDMGVAYARTVHSTHDFHLPSDWLQLPATCHHNDKKLMELAHRFVENAPYGRPWMFYLWGHSYEFEGDNNWHVIEEFAEYMGGRDDIWYATNIEIRDYVEAFKKLILSADGRRIFNPTSTTLYLCHWGREYTLLPGQETVIE
ncbi:MAG: polysaccharide deacetylase family protein [Clostridia bacterium]|nr:polysaccharide deacetylase family protein [Clostridia bacterium]